MENEIQQTENQLVREVSQPLYQNKGWMKFLGVLMIIYGVFMAMTIVGIIIAWLPIWLGVLLNQAANKIEFAHTTGHKEAMVGAQRNLSNYFAIYGVLALIGIVAMIILIFVIMSTGLLTDLQNFDPDNF